MPEKKLSLPRSLVCTQLSLGQHSLRAIWVGFAVKEFRSHNRQLLQLERFGCLTLLHKTLGTDEVGKDQRQKTSKKEEGEFHSECPADAQWTQGIRTNQDSKDNLGFPSGAMVKNLPAVQEQQVRSLSQEEPLEAEMTTLSSVFA